MKKVKNVYFNLDNEADKKIYDYIEENGRNFSNFVKQAVAKEIESNHKIELSKASEE